MWDDTIRLAAETYHVPETWIKAVIQVESNWNPLAFNPNDPGGARGLMQITAPTARALGVTDLNHLFEPEYNIDRGTDLLGRLRQSYGDDFRRIYSAYNSGRPDLWETSREVAANVSRAVQALEGYLQEAVEVLVQNGGTVTKSVESGGLVLLLVAVLLWAWTTKR